MIKNKATREINEENTSGDNLDRLLTMNYDDIEVSTKTFVVMTNLLLNIKNLFEFLPITVYIQPTSKKRNRKKKSDDKCFIGVSDGSILCMKYEKSIRGAEIKKTVSAKRREITGKESKCFRNSFTVIIVMLRKAINMKICRNGMIQLTGCKTDEQVEYCTKHIWNLIRNQPDIYTFIKGEEFEALIIPALRNIDFDLGFNVDREKLAKYMMEQIEDSDDDNDVIKIGNNSSYVSPENFIEDIMDIFKATTKQKDNVLEWYNKIKNRSSKINRAKPQSVASALVFWWIRYNKINISIKDFAQKCNLSELTINRIVKEIVFVLDG